MRNSKPERLGGLEGRAVVAAFDAGAVTSDAAARAIRMMDRLASCFDDGRCPELIEHQVVTLVCSGLRLAMRISTTTMSCATIRCWQCSRASSLRAARIARRWPASRRSRLAGAVEEVVRIVAQIRRRWPLVRILLRADLAFAREELMAWCEANGVHFYSGWRKPIGSSPKSRPSLRGLRRRAGVPASRRGASRTSGG